MWPYVFVQNIFLVCFCEASEECSLFVGSMETLWGRPVIFVMVIKNTFLSPYVLWDAEKTCSVITAKRWPMAHSLS